MRVRVRAEGVGNREGEGRGYLGGDPLAWVALRCAVYTPSLGPKASRYLHLGCGWGLSMCPNICYLG